MLLVVPPLALVLAAICPCLCSLPQNSLWWHQKEGTAASGHSCPTSNVGTAQHKSAACRDTSHFIPKSGWTAGLCVPFDSYLTVLLVIAPLALVLVPTGKQLCSLPQQQTQRESVVALLGITGQSTGGVHSLRTNALRIHPI